MFLKQYNNNMPETLWTADDITIGDDCCKEEQLQFYQCYKFIMQETYWTSDDIYYKRSLTLSIVLLEEGNDTIL